jgi:hypothetical protein
MTEQIPEGLKWIVLIFLAGFIGQFGRVFSEWTIRRLGRGQRKFHPEEESPRRPPEAAKSPDAVSAPDGKAVKKALKAMTKLQKKKYKQ